MVDEKLRRLAAEALLRARDRVSHAFHNPDEHDTPWRDQLTTETANLGGIEGLEDALDLALFRTVYLTVHDTSIADTISQAHHLDRALPGAGMLLCMASLDGSASIGAWEDFEGYDTESREVVAAEHFRQRWLGQASKEPHWASLTETAIGMLSLPPCGWSLDVFEDDEAVVNFWLHGAYLEIFGDPNPHWRGSTEQRTARRETSSRRR